MKANLNLLALTLLTGYQFAAAAGNQSNVNNVTNVTYATNTTNVTMPVVVVEEIQEIVSGDIPAQEVAALGTKIKDPQLEFNTYKNVFRSNDQLTVSDKSAQRPFSIQYQPITGETLFQPTYPNVTKPTIPDFKPVDSCNCKEGYNYFYKGECYRDLETTLVAANGDTVHVRNTTIFYKPIKFKYDIRVVGDSCGGEKPLFMYNFQNKPDNRKYSKRPDYKYSKELMDGAMFVPRSKEWGQKVFFDNIEWTVDPENPTSYGSALQFSTKGNMLDYADPYLISFSLTNCDFHDITSRGRGGMVVGFNTVHQGYIENCTFTNNINHEYEDDTWNAGGAVWIRVLGSSEKKGSYFKFINSTMVGNDNEFWHSFGGGIYIEHLDNTKIDIDGHFENNTAGDGGAINIAWIDKQSEVHINGTFIKNRARSWDDMRNTARAGAVKFAEINGEVTLTGYFIENLSEGRGGVVASSRIYHKADITLGGSFINNTAWEAGAVWDQIYSNKDQENGSTGSGRMCKGAKMKILAGSVFKGNTAAATQFDGEKKTVNSIYHDPSNQIHLMEDEFMKKKKLKNKDVKRYCEPGKACERAKGDIYWDDNDDLIIKGKAAGGLCLRDSKFYKDNMYD